MISLKTIAPLLAITGLFSLVGCAAPTEEDDSSSSEDAALTEARSTSEQAFEAQMNELEQRYEKASSEEVSTQSFGIPSQVGARSLPFGSIRKKLCEHLAPFGSLEHAYFYYGGYVSADVVVGAQVGMDFVFDLYNRQSAAFTWKVATANVGTAGSIGISGYVGYGFGAKANVLDAWAGRFDSISGEIEIPGTKLGVEGSAFHSPDNTIVGGSIGVAAGLALSWPLPVTGTVETGFWVPFDAATQKMSAIAFGANRSLATGTAMNADPRLDHAAKNKPYQYVQFAKSSDLALGLLWTAPAGVSLVPAAQAVAIGVLRDSGRTLAQICPRH